MEFFWSGRSDLNRRPLAPKASALNQTAPRPAYLRLYTLVLPSQEKDSFFKYALPIYEIFL